MGGIRSYDWEGNSYLIDAGLYYTKWRVTRLSRSGIERDIRIAVRNSIAFIFSR